MSRPNIKEIDWAISELLQQESSFRTYSRLADLYAVRDRLREGQNANMENEPTAQPISDRSGTSEFLQAVSEKDQEKVLLIMDELMETLRVVNPRVYDSVLHKIARL